MTVYLITGATGVVGSGVAEQLLRDSDANLRILVRAGSDHDLRMRVEKLLQFWGVTDSELGRRVQAVRGDVTLPQLGMAAETYRRMTRECTHIIHCAGAVRMNLPLEEARRSAVTATKNVTALARACRDNETLQKVEFVSTVGVGGRRLEPLPERWITEERTFHNTYEQAKAEAEDIVATEIHSGLPATVHRPSMVIGDAQTGKVIHFQVFYHLAEFLSGCRTYGLFPTLGQTKLDLVPVDYVARSIVWSSRCSDMTGRVLHLCTGPSAALAIGTLRDRVRARFERAGIRVPHVWTLPNSLFRGAVSVVGTIVSERNRRALGTLPIFLDYLAADQTFENVESTRVLTAAGIELPQIEQALDNVLTYYLAR